MDQLALKNIDTLLNINENTSIIFNNKEIIIVEDESVENINVDNDNLNIEYTLYFTFNQIFNILRNNNNENKIQLINNLNNSINNLYENIYFLKLIDENNTMDVTMDDICLKLDIITNKYSKTICYKIYEQIYSYLEYLSTAFVISHQIKPTYVTNIFKNKNDSDEGSNDVNSDNSDNSNNKSNDKSNDERNIDDLSDSEKKD